MTILDGIANPHTFSLSRTMSAVFARSALRAQVLGRSGLHSSAVARSAAKEADGSVRPPVDQDAFED